VVRFSTFVTPGAVGVPIAIKYLCDIEDVPTACGIPMFRSNIAKWTSIDAAKPAELA